MKARWADWTAWRGSFAASGFRAAAEDLVADHSAAAGFAVAAADSRAAYPARERMPESGGGPRA